jgi:chromosome segregation ATPase
MNFQVEEYNILRAHAQIRLITDLQELDLMNREQKADQDKFVDDSRTRNELELEIKRKKHERAEARERVDRLTEYIESTENALKALDSLFETMKADVDASRRKAYHRFTNERNGTDRRVAVFPSKKLSMLHGSPRKILGRKEGWLCPQAESESQDSALATTSADLT